MSAAVHDVLHTLALFLPKAMAFVVVLVVGWVVARLLRAGLARWSIVGLGVIAALNQIGVATSVTTPVLIAVLATVAGILIVGVGGGLVRPMQARWESWLDRAAQESQAIAENARAYRAGQADARARLAQEKVAAAAPVPGSAVPPVPAGARPTAA